MLSPPKMRARVVQRLASHQTKFSFRVRHVAISMDISGHLATQAGWICRPDCPQRTLWKARAIASLSSPEPSIGESTPVALDMNHGIKQKGSWIRS